MEPRKIWATKRTARFLDLSENAVRVKADRGELPHFKTEDGKRLFFADEIEGTKTTKKNNK